MCTKIVLSKEIVDIIQGKMNEFFPTPLLNSLNESPSEARSLLNMQLKRREALTSDFGLLMIND